VVTADEVVREGEAVHPATIAVMTARSAALDTSAR
jgi:hypothetical protein